MNSSITKAFLTIATFSFLLSCKNGSSSYPITESKILNQQDSTLKAKIASIFNDNSLINNDKKIDSLFSLFESSFIDKRNIEIEKGITFEENLSNKEKTKRIESIPIGVDTAKKYTNSYLNIHCKDDSNCKDNLEKSAYIEKYKIEKLIRDSIMIIDKSKYSDYDLFGYRIYHAVNKENKNTIILRLTYGFNDIPHNNRYTVAYDYGDLCPKKCPEDIFGRQTQNRPVDKKGYYPD